MPGWVYEVVWSVFEGEDNVQEGKVTKIARWAWWDPKAVPKNTAIIIKIRAIKHADLERLAKHIEHIKLSRSWYKHEKFNQSHI